MGGDTTMSNPAPVDYSASMMQMSMDSKAVQMAQVGAQIIGMELMADNRAAQISAASALGFEMLDAKVEIAQMQFRQLAKEETNRHEEALAEFDVKKLEIEKGDSIDLDALMA